MQKTTGEYITNILVNYLEKYNLLGKLCAIATDGGKNFTSENVGVVGRLKN